MLNLFGLQVTYCSLSGVMELQWAAHVNSDGEKKYTDRKNFGGNTSENLVKIT